MLSLYNTNGSTRISLYGQSPTSYSGGEVSVLSSNGTKKFEILGQTDALTGGKITLKRDDGVVGTTLVAEDGNGEGATFQLHQSAGGLGLRLEGDYFNGGRAMFYNSRSNVTVDIQGDGDTGGAGYLKINTTNGANRVTLIGYGSGGGGEMRLANTNALNRLSFYGQGANGAGEINVFDTSGTETIEILGQQSSTLGSRITLRQSSGTSSLTLDGEYGSAGEGSAIMLNNSAGSQRLRIEGDESNAGYLVVYGTNGAVNITLDGFSPSGNGRVITEELQITSATTTIAAGASLTPATGFVRISGSGGPVTLSAITAIATGSGTGLMLVLEGTSDVNTVTVPDNANTRLAAARTLGLNDTLTLIWNGTDWVEISFSNN